MPKIPGTEVNAVFQVVAGKYAPLFYGSGESGVAIGAMNAGDSGGLYVGGGTLNRAFKGVLVTAGQATGRYAQRHLALAQSVDAGAIHVEDYSDDDPARTIAICNKPVGPVSDHTGLAFLDVFADGFCPKGNPANRAMSYVAPPRGSAYGTDEAFLKDVATTGIHAVEAAVAYNAWAADNGRPQVEALRLCTFSAGAYRREGMSVDDVALAIFSGIEAGLQADATGLTEIQMPVGDSTSDPLFTAVKARLQGG